MTEPIGCTCHSISSTTAGVKIYICLRRLLLVCLSFKALLYYISNIWIARSYYLLYAKLLCPVPIFLFFHLLSYVVFTHVHRCVIFLMKKLVLEHATRALCSSQEERVVCSGLYLKLYYFSWILIFFHFKIHSGGILVWWW